MSEAISINFGSIARINSEITQIQSELFKMANSFDGLEQRVSANEDGILAFESKANELDSALAEKMDTLASLESALAGLQDDIAANQDDVQSLEAEIAQLRSEIEAFIEKTKNGGPDLEWFSDFMKRLWTDDALVRADSKLQDFVFSFIRFPPTPHGLRNQASAIAKHDAQDRLSQIPHPTLVMSGDEDSLIDPRNSLILAIRIPHAEMRVFPNLRHAFHLERPDLVNPVIHDFLDANGHRPARRRPAIGIT